MELKNYIEEATKLIGTVAKLAKALGVAPTTISDAKAHRRGLPVYACFKLAALLNVDKGDIIAASELVTEKDPERRAVFLPFVRISATHIAWAALAIVASLATTTEKAEANQRIREAEKTQYTLCAVTYWMAHRPRLGLTWRP